MRRLLPPTLVLLLTALMAANRLLLPAPDVPATVRLVGVVVAVVGLALPVAGSRRFERADTNIKTFDDPDHLVDNGLFALSRNPMYLDFLAFLTGLAVALGSPIAAAGPVLFFLAADRWYIPFEERRMAAVFGEDYAHYRRRVGRWIGRPAAATDRVEA